MPIYVKDPADHLWKQANNPTSKLLYVRYQGTWRSGANVWIRDAGTWKTTGYVGIPGTPTNLRVTSANNNFATMALAWDAPTTGAPVSTYHVYFYNTDGSFQSVANAGNVLSYSHAVNINTKYQFEVFAVSSAGVLSPASNRVKYGIGHPQQTRQDPVYGWYPTPWLADCSTVYASTVAVVSGGATYPGANATDGNAGTYWASGARSSTTYFDALRVATGSAYVRIYSVKVTPGVAGRFWLGMAQDSVWYGGNTYPTNPNFWFDATARLYFAHEYLYASPSNQSAAYEFVIATNLNFTADRCLIDVAQDELKSLHSGLRAAIFEIETRVQDWTIVSYNTVVTVTQQNNYYW